MHIFELLFLSSQHSKTQNDEFPVQKIGKPANIHVLEAGISESLAFLFKSTNNFYISGWFLNTNLPSRILIKAMRNEIITFLSSVRFMQFVRLPSRSD